jgi:hypothetical protein
MLKMQMSDKTRALRLHSICMHDAVGRHLGELLSVYSLVQHSVPALRMKFCVELIHKG